MVSVFDGMSGVLTGIFGAPVLHLPQSGGQQSIPSILRFDPIEVPDPVTGATMIESPTWRIPRPAADAVKTGDRLVYQGREFRVTNGITTGSPAADGFMLFELEEVTP